MNETTSIKMIINSEAIYITTINKQKADSMHKYQRNKCQNRGRDYKN